MDEPVVRSRWSFPLSSLFVLMLGIAAGYILNQEALRLWGRPPTEAMPATSPAYVIEPPDRLWVRVVNGMGALESETECLVLPDGTINLGAAGSVNVAGKTIDETRSLVSKALTAPGAERVQVDVVQSDSKAYYILTRSGAGDNVVRAPITGNETVLDAIAFIGGLPSDTPLRLSISRPGQGIGKPKVLPVRWDPRGGGVDPRENYQLMPGDRLLIEPLPSGEPSANATTSLTTPHRQATEGGLAAHRASV